jgi:uncharacterized protein (DUF427 family)
VLNARHQFQLVEPDGGTPRELGDVKCRFHRRKLARQALHQSSIQLLFHRRRACAGAHGARSVRSRGSSSLQHKQHSMESVWDYPRPPRLEPVPVVLRVNHARAPLAHTEQGWRVLETSHPPTYYFPASDVAMQRLQQSPGSSFCEWKGRAVYWALDGRPVAWIYPDPTPAFLPLKDCLAFYPSRVDECWVGEERAVAQAGDFYGGWITSNIQGPFKGAPGTLGW